MLMKKKCCSVIGLALGVALFSVASLLAAPQSQQYPQYQQKASSPEVQTPVKAPQPAPAQPVVNSTAQGASTSATAEPVSSRSSAPVQRSAVVPTSPIGSVFTSNLVKVEKIPVSAPGEVGADYKYIVRVTALENVTNVSLLEHLPGNVTYVGSNPEVAKDGNSLNWRYDTMRKGEVQDVLITLRPTQAGDFLTSTKVCIDPVVMLAFRAGEPKLAIEKTGPREADVNEQVTFTVKVTNIGTAPAKGVVVVDSLPQGLRANEAQPAFNIGDLDVGESKQISVPVTTVAQGDWVNTASVSASNANSVSAAAPIAVRHSSIKVSKAGPARQTITRNASYTITVTNDGSTMLSNVVVTDDIPSGNRLVSATGNPTTQNNERFVWNIASLAPGESQTYTITLSADVPMNSVNRAAATGRTPLGKTVSAAASAATVWDVPPGILTEIVDSVDPVRVGGTVTYTVRITNQGSHREIDSRVRVIFSDEITPVSCSENNVRIEGKIVTLPAYIIKPRGVLTFTVQARAAKEGTATTRLEFNSSFLETPINKDETTFVY